MLGVPASSGILARKNVTTFPETVNLGSAGATPPPPPPPAPPPVLPPAAVESVLVGLVGPSPAPPPQEAGRVSAAMPAIAQALQRMKSRRSCSVMESAIAGVRELSTNHPD